MKKPRNWLIVHARNRHAGAVEGNGNPKKEASKKACRGKVVIDD
jgi:hypothetical protein